MSIGGDSFSAGYTGGKVLGIAAHTGLKARGFVPQEDTTITVAKDKDAADLMTLLGYTGNTFKLGIYYPISLGNWFTAITITVGSIVIYNE